MVNIAKNGVHNIDQQTPDSSIWNMMAGHDIPPIGELVSAAVAEFRCDLEMYHPVKPALTYALIGETHAAILRRWRRHNSAIKSTLLTAFLKELSNILNEFHTSTARIAPTINYMYGQREQAMKLETLAEITLEEISRIETELTKIQTEESLH